MLVRSYNEIYTVISVFITQSFETAEHLSVECGNGNEKRSYSDTRVLQ